MRREPMFKQYGETPGARSYNLRGCRVSEPIVQPRGRWMSDRRVDRRRRALGPPGRVGGRDGGGGRRGDPPADRRAAPLDGRRRADAARYVATALSGRRSRRTADARTGNTTMTKRPGLGARPCRFRAGRSGAGASGIHATRGRRARPLKRSADGARAAVQPICSSSSCTASQSASTVSSRVLTSPSLRIASVSSVLRAAS